MGEVLPYAGPLERPPRSRLPVVAFAWSLLSPLTTAGILYLIVEGPLLDLDDVLPRDGAIAVLALIVMGVPLAGVALGVAASGRAATTVQRALATAASVLGVIWIILGCAGIGMVVRGDVRAG